MISRITSKWISSKKFKIGKDFKEDKITGFIWRKLSRKTPTKSLAADDKTPTSMRINNLIAVVAVIEFVLMSTSRSSSSTCVWGDLISPKATTKDDLCYPRATSPHHVTPVQPRASAHVYWAPVVRVIKYI